MIRRFVGSDTSFTRGDWVFEKPIEGDTLNVSVNLNDTVIVNCSNVIQNFKGLCVGDVNGSNLPGTGEKGSNKIVLNYNKIMTENSNQYFEIPIRVTSDLKLGAVSLIMKYPEELVSIINVQSPLINGENSLVADGNNLVYNISGDELSIGWYDNTGAINAKNNDTLIIINVKTTKNFKPGGIIRFSIVNNPLCEIADESGNPVNNVILKTLEIRHSYNQNIEEIERVINNDLFIFPNPSETMVNIRYNIANDGLVKISLFNVLGEKVVDVVNKTGLKGTYNLELNLSTMQSGVYMCKMVLADKSVIVKRLIISE
jgi:hypothetical protein